MKKLLPFLVLIALSITVKSQSLCGYIKILNPGKHYVYLLSGSDTIQKWKLFNDNPSWFSFYSGKKQLSIYIKKISATENGDAYLFGYDANSSEKVKFIETKGGYRCEVSPPVLKMIHYKDKVLPSKDGLSGFIKLEKDRLCDIYLLLGKDTLAKTRTSDNKMKSFAFKGIQKTKDLVLYIKKLSAKETGDVALVGINELTKGDTIWAKFIETNKGYKCELKPAYLKYLFHSQNMPPSKDPQTAGEFLNRGVAKYLNKNYKSAIEDFTKAIELNPNYGEAYNDRGNCEDETGDKDGACSDYNKAISLGFSVSKTFLSRNCNSAGTTNDNKTNKTKDTATKDLYSLKKNTSLPDTGYSPDKEKANYIYNFAKNIEWPSANKLKEFTIGILGNNNPSLQKELENLSKSRLFNNLLPIKVKVFKTIESIVPTQMLYVNGDDGFNHEELFSKIKGKGTMLIAENSANFNKSMINFVEINKEKKFSLNQKVVEGEKFKIKNGLISMAILDEKEWGNVYSKFKSLLETNKNGKIEINRQDLETVLFDKELQKKEERIRKLEEEKKEANHKSEVKLQKTIIYSVVTGLLLVLVFAILIFRSLRVTHKQKEIIELKSKEIEEKNKDITDSITYAKRIQQAKLPRKEEIYESLPNCFVLFKPKDIVSGDFYFFHKKNQSLFIASADCTGHGVPGAFMSMIGSEKLEDAVSNSSDTSEILKLLNKGIKTSLRQSDSDESTRDGMDIALCSVNTTNYIVKYAGANRPLYIIRKGQTEIKEIKATKKAIGGLTADDQHFDTHELKLQQGDTFYISTDGYADQFSSQDKKLTTKKFKQILLDIQGMTMQEQEKHLDNFIENWKTGIEQIDDILVIGVRL